MSLMLTLQIMHLPFCHGIKVSHLGSFPLDFNRPDDSSTAGMLAFDSARLTLLL